jgi:hypothetical protein
MLFVYEQTRTPGLCMRCGAARSTPDK